ncbi:hypothetical protein C8R42DRAFT_431294 [Lentinula raphanica]|nr:hypothetical protein C8R42DRAFT_431294 [Lentinula raphanica]
MDDLQCYFRNSYPESRPVNSGMLHGMYRLVFLLLLSQRKMLHAGIHRAQVSRRRAHDRHLRAFVFLGQGRDSRTSRRSPRSNKKQTKSPVPAVEQKHSSFCGQPNMALVHSVAGWD